MSKYLIGVDIGGTKILSAIATNKGEIFKSLTIKTEAKKGKSASLRNVIRSIRSLLEETDIPLSQISAIGIGVPGPMDYKKGTVLNPPNLYGWKKVNLKKIIQKEFRKPVYIDNDANAAALGEFRFGAGRGTTNMVYITISTGIGGGIIINKKIYRGSIGGAGEIGHTVIDMNGMPCNCGNRGCLETLASGRAMTRMARELAKKNKSSLIYKLAKGKLNNINAYIIEEAALAGDKPALRIVKEIGKRIGIGVSNIINMLEPDKVVIGGGLSNLGNMIFAPIRKTVTEIALEPSRSRSKVVPAKFKKEAGVFGAIALCMDGSS